MTLRWSMALCAGLAPGAVASAQSERPESARRVVHGWDFEDPVSRIEPVPVGWFRAQDAPSVRERAGFPAWNVPQMTSDQAFSGRHSIVLPTRGGSTSLMLSGGTIAALPDADYSIRAQVRTDGLSHARARLVAWFLDDHLKPLTETESRSPLFISQGGWRRIETNLQGVEGAAWIQIELQVLQPEQYENPHGSQQVWEQDYSGSAWFDDVQVRQVPRVDLSISAPAGIVVEPEAPEVMVLVRDLAGESLRIELALYDMDGKRIAGETMPAPDGGRRMAWRPSLPAFGWYRAAMRASSSEGEVGKREVDFVWAPRGEAPDASRRHAFGVTAEDLSSAQRAQLPEFMKRTLAGAATLAVWTPGLSLEQAEESAGSLSRDAEALLAQGVELTFVLTHIPGELAREVHIDPDDPIALLLAENDPWAPYLGKLLASFGERVRRWQLGPTGGASAFFRPRCAEEVEEIRAKLRRIIPRPLIALPWSLENAMSPGHSTADVLTASWPLGIGADGAETLVMPEGAAPRRTIVIETPRADTFGGRAAAIELAKRAVSAWAAGARHLVAQAPWRTSPEAPDRLMPGVEAAVIRTLCQRLTDSTIVGKLPTAEGATVFIADSPSGGMLIGWNDSADPNEAMLRGWLGPGPIVGMDPLGNRAVYQPGDDGRYAVPLTEMPVFVTGVDVSLALFRSKLRIEPPFLAARAEKHQVEVVIENPWPIGILGRVRIAEPAAWEISPRVIPFSLAPGKSARVPIELSFTLGEEAGERQMLAEVELTAERHYPVQRLPLYLELGLPGVELIPSYRLEDRGNGGSLVVSLHVTNQGAAPLTMEAFAQAPGYRAFSAPVSELAPGASLTRRFRFDAGADRLKGRTIRVGLREQDGTGRLNKMLLIE